MPNEIDLSPYDHKKQICWNCKNLREDETWLYCSIHKKRTMGFSACDFFELREPWLPILKSR